MNISELVTTLKKAEENQNTLRTIITITNSTIDNVVDNVTLLFNNAEPTNKVKIESLIEDLQSKVSEAKNEYEDAYDESQNAIGCIESMSCELDSIDDMSAVIDEIQALIEDTEDDSEEDANNVTPSDNTTTIHTQL